MCPIQEESFPFFPISKRKRVRILAEPQIVALIRPLSELSDDERLQVWWQKHEYESSKMASKIKCRELRKKGTYVGALTEAYEQAKADTQELHTYDASVGEDLTLVDWCSDSESPRGLERWSSKMHGYLRGKHVREVKHAVLLEQARQFLIDDRDDEEIARVAQRASKQSRAFAILLGAADAVVASGCYSRKRINFEQSCEPSRKVMKISPTSSPNNSDGEDRCLSPSLLFDNF